MDRAPTLFLHGVPSASYSFMRVLTALETAGWHAYAPDWIGFGFSEKPQPRYGFNYTEQEFHKVGARFRSIEVIIL